MSLDGILPIYKELNVRSTDCVSKVKALLPKGTKIGHAGTLDSTADGLLLLLIGRATRLADFIMSMPKIYRVCVKFGLQTSTDDASGDIIAQGSTDHITDKLLQEILPSFLGVRPQIPPNISAVHIDGKRAHDLARSGKDFQIAPKNIKILRINQTKKIQDSKAEFLIECTKGTYIRSFARDLGIALKTVACVYSLTRESVWNFDAQTAIPSNMLPNLTLNMLEKHILSLERLIGFLPSFQLDEASEKAMRNGLAYPISKLRLLSLGQSAQKDKLLLYSNNVFSLCGLTIKDSVAFASPQCNIFLS